MSIFGCFFRHKWKYDTVREVSMFRQDYLGGMKFGDQVEFITLKQFRTCETCGLTQDKKVGEY